MSEGESFTDALKNPQRVLQQPCVRTALMWGIATGSVAAAHRLRSTGELLCAERLALDVVLGFQAAALKQVIWAWACSSPPPGFLGESSCETIAF